MVVIVFFGSQYGLETGLLGAIAGTIPRKILGGLFESYIGNQFDKIICPKSKLLLYRMKKVLN